MGSKKIVTKIKDALSRGSRSPSPEPGPSTGECMNADSPFTRFVLSNLDEQDHKMVAMAFAPQIQTDCDARNLDFDDFFHLLGHKTKGDAIRTLNRVFKDNEIVFSNSAKNSVGRPKKVYLLSVNQFEEVLLAANTETGKKWRKLVLKIKNLVVQYMKIEMEATVTRAQQEFETRTAQLAIKDEEHAARLAVSEQEKAALATQLKNLREAKSYLYAFHLFDDRYKCGVTDNPEKREKQHQTSCPSGRMVHSVTIACKQSERLMDSIMKCHGSHVRQEEYHIEGGEDRVRLVLDTIARVEESLHSVPFVKYEELQRAVNAVLDGTFQAHRIPIPQRELSVTPTLTSAEAALVPHFERFLQRRCETGNGFEVNSTELLNAVNGFFRSERVFVNDNDNLIPQKLVRLMGHKDYEVRSDLGHRKKGRGYIFFFAYSQKIKCSKKGNAFLFCKGIRLLSPDERAPEVSRT